MLLFLIPVLHPDAAENWATVRENLRTTLNSIEAQRSPRWRALVVANHGSDLPEMPQSTCVLWVDLPTPNPLPRELRGVDWEHYKRVVRRDKGTRLLRGLCHARDHFSEITHVMPVDADDLVSNRLAGFVEEHPDENGWVIDHGYVHRQGSRIILVHSPFDQLCGTCHIIRRDLWSVPDSPDEASGEYTDLILGSHRFVRAKLEREGFPLRPLPFPGAVYRIGHGENSSGIMGLAKLFEGWMLRSHPLRFVSRLSRLRPVTPRISREFVVESRAV